MVMLPMHLGGASDVPQIYANSVAIVARAIVDVDELADRADAGRQDHGLEAVGAADQLRRIALARAVDEHALAAADVRGEHLGGDRLLQRDDLGEPALLRRRR